MRATKIIILILGLMSIGLVTLRVTRSGSPVTAGTAPTQATAPAPQSLASTTIATQPTTPVTQARSSSDQTSEARFTVGPRATVVTVNGTPITSEELENELNHLLISTASHSAMDQKKKDEMRKAALE